MEFRGGHEPRAIPSRGLTVEFGWGHEPRAISLGGLAESAAQSYAECFTQVSRAEKQLRQGVSVTKQLATKQLAIKERHDAIAKQGLVRLGQEGAEVNDGGATRESAELRDPGEVRGEEEIVGLFLKARCLKTQAARGEGSEGVAADCQGGA